MSGRKASEVNSLLRNGQQVRQGAMDLLNSSMKQFDRSEDMFEKALRNAQSHTDVKLQLDAANAEFPEAAAEIRDALEAARRIVRSVKGNAKPGQKLHSDSAALTRDYEKADEEADRIARDVRRRKHGWYCDEEFERAGRLASKYRQLKKSVKSLNDRAVQLANNLGDDTARLQEVAAEMIRLQKSADELEKRAHDVAKLRASANAAKRAVTEDFDKVDADLAAKFAKSEFGELEKRVKEYLQGTDKQVVKQCTAITSEIHKFGTVLDARYAAFLQEQQATRQAIERLDERLSNRVFSDPMSVFRDQESDQMDLRSFLDAFCSGRYVDEINSLMRSARALFDKEQFTEARERIAQADELASTAAKHAADYYENRVKTIDSMLAIQDAMMRLNYDVNVHEENGIGELSGGYTIVCTAGDERITFENMFVSEDGQLNFGIDHKESTTGTCGATWKSIRSELGNEGVLVEDITWNGRSVLGPGAASAASVQNQQARLGNS